MQSNAPVLYFYSITFTALVTLCSTVLSDILRNNFVFETSFKNKK